MFHFSGCKGSQKVCRATVYYSDIWRWYVPNAMNCPSKSPAPPLHTLSSFPVMDPSTCTPNKTPGHVFPRMCASSFMSLESLLKLQIFSNYKGPVGHSDLWFVTFWYSVVSSRFFLNAKNKHSNNNDVTKWQKKTGREESF